MTGTSNKGSERLPIGVFVGIAAVVCLALALSAGYSYITLSRFRAEYLANQGHEIGTVLEMQLRGPGRRNPAYWQSAFDDSFQDYKEFLRFVALVDANGQVLAVTGGTADALSRLRPGFTTYQGTGVYVLDMPIPTGRGIGAMMHQALGWRLCLGMKTSSGEFIRRQAIAQVLIAAAAILTLIALVYFAVHTLNRFLQLKAREESERQLRSLGTMAATLAHEIRNPLGAMKGLTQLAQEELPADHHAQASLKTIVSEAERLENLVTDLLTFARRPQPQMSEFDFVRLVEDVQGMMRPRFETAGVRFEVASGRQSVSITSDENGLRQVLLNVFLNALEATPSGREVTVRLVRKDGSDGLVLEVDDSGPGLGKRDPEEFFQPFSTSKVQGTGLGLAVSRRIVESIGGDLTLANRPGGGARCTLVLPAKGAAAGSS